MVNESITVTLHLPGLQKTVQYSFDPIPNAKLSEKIARDFGQEPRRSNISIIGENLFGTFCASQLWLSSTRPVKTGDILVLCTRFTTVQGQNDYFETQQDALLHNTYLFPPLEKKIAIDLLMQIKVNFDLLGHKYYLPGAVLYEHQMELEKELSEWYST